MKKYFINKCMNYIKGNTNYNDIKLAEIKYGLEGIYLTFTKIFIIFVFAWILGIFKSSLIFSLLYNILRVPSFGLHATKSWVCLLSSALLFLGIPILCMNITFPIILKLFICIIGILLMLKNAPADTYKKPIVSKKRRNKYKFISVILTIVYSFIIILISNDFIINCLLFSIIMQNCMISPLVYKIFKLPYNNYINYLKKHPELSYE